MASITDIGSEFEKPYPGIRPFSVQEWPLFCGRDVQIGQIIELLQENQFVIVTGGSGSGKTSLVRSGVIPALRLGAISSKTIWLPIVFTPKKAPITRLAKSLKDNLRVSKRDEIRNEDVVDIIK